MKKNINYKGIDFQINEKAEVFYNNCQLKTYELTSYNYIQIYSPITQSSKLIPVHRLVAAAFCKIPEGYSIDELFVDHIDNNGRNNKPKNLRWLTRQQNNARLHAMRARRKNFHCQSHKDQVLKIFDKKTGKTHYFKSYDDAGTYFGITRQSIINSFKTTSRDFGRKMRYVEWVNADLNDETKKVFISYIKTKYKTIDKALKYFISKGNKTEKIIQFLEDYRKDI